MEIDNIKKVIGKKQTQKALSKGQVKKIYIAQDADKTVINGIVNICKDKNIEIIYIESMKKLGKNFGIDVKAAVAATLK